MNLMQQHEAWLAKWKESGKHALAFDTPCCHKPLETPAPAIGSDQTWDTFTTCPHCHSLFYKVVNAREVITANAVPSLGALVE